MSTIEILILVGSWIGAHFLSIFLVPENIRKTLLLYLMIASLLIAYLYKPYTYDLDKYSIYFSTGYITTQGWDIRHGGELILDQRDISDRPYSGYSVGFDYFVRAITKILPDGKFVSRFDPYTTAVYTDPIIFFIMGCTLALLLMAIRNLFCSSWIMLWKRNILLLSLMTILGSEFYFLGSQNTVRHFIGLTIIILSISFVYRRQYLISLCLIYLAYGFHSSSVLFGIVGVLGCYCLSNKRCNIPVAPTVDILWIEVYALIFGLAAYMAIKLSAMTGLMTTDLPYMDLIKNYIFLEEQQSSRERLENWVKVLAVSSMFVITELTIGRKSDSPLFNIRSYRRCIFLFVTPLAMFPEIYSRALMLYFSTELLFIVWALSDQRWRVRLAGALILLTYGIAPNALNILVGSGVYHSF